LFLIEEKPQFVPMGEKKRLFVITGSRFQYVDLQFIQYPVIQL
jgi:hypothetical protein